MSGRIRGLFTPLALMLAGWMPFSQQGRAAEQGWPADVSENSFALPSQAGNFHYYSLNTRQHQPIVSALIVLHGHPRDVGNTLAAAAEAAQGVPAASNTAIVAPLFQVAASRDSRCRSSGLPAASAGDALWSCRSWLGGEPDSQQRITAFAAMDNLLLTLKQRWPALRNVTVAGFSAGGQFVQHYIGFAHPPEGVALRFVAGDPGSWLYFDQRKVTGCPNASRWKYGVEDLPGWLNETAAAARQRYRLADVHYLEGADDRGKGPGRYWKILDKSCAAMAQGEFRLDRGLNYQQYEREVLKPVTPHKLTVVPGCAHDVRCVFPSKEGRQALFTP
ncbi:membrane protein [Erwinia typographi]|uniref:Membrane protein n=1 Tax=Erwinia typographi TaxID=371042 RepID=A0A0A3Z9F7_9GAMM|nr:hypothetical protein [Erwinia typographi]KGT95722.1 membrane protein [Erwinia typographi]